MLEAHLLFEELIVNLCTPPTTAACAGLSDQRSVCIKMASVEETWDRCSHNGACLSFGQTRTQMRSPLCTKISGSQAYPNSKCS